MHLGYMCEMQIAPFEKKPKKKRHRSQSRFINGVCFCQHGKLKIARNKGVTSLNYTGIVYAGRCSVEELRLKRVIANDCYAIPVI